MSSIYKGTQHTIVPAIAETKLSVLSQGVVLDEGPGGGEVQRRAVQGEYCRIRSHVKAVDMIDSMNFF